MSTSAISLRPPQDLNWLQLTTSTMIWAKIVNVLTINLQMYVKCNCNVEWKVLIKHMIHMVHHYSNTILYVSIFFLFYLDAQNAITKHYWKLNITHETSAALII